MEKNKYQEIINKVEEIINNNTNELKKYFELGKIFKENQKIFKGENNLKSISEYLKQKFGKGYSYSSLVAMKKYYVQFRNYNELKELSFLLPWSQITELAKLYDIKEVEFYLKRSIENEWSVTQLKTAMEDDEYEKFIKKVESDDYRFNIKKISIKNYKSLVDITIEKPSRFMVFVGANASGKSNIFEAIELMFHSMYIKDTAAIEMFGGIEKIRNFNKPDEDINISISLEDDIIFGINYHDKLSRTTSESDKLNKKFFKSFSRIFFDNTKKGLNKLKFHDKLAFDGSNLTSILSKILNDKEEKEFFLAQLSVYVPGLKDLKITKNEFDGTLSLEIQEKGLKKAISGELISEGTYSIIGLLTLLYQTDEQQFLCIEEPENGLNPKVQQDFVELFRNVCEEGHYIWLTTHSQSIVSQLKPEELIIVNKIDGETKIKQFYDDDILKNDYEQGLVKMDQAWLNNELDGGLPW